MRADTDAGAGAGTGAEAAGLALPAAGDGTAATGAAAAGADTMRVAGGGDDDGGNDDSGAGRGGVVPPHSLLPPPCTGTGAGADDGVKAGFVASACARAAAMAAVNRDTSLAAGDVVTGATATAVLDAAGVATPPESTLPRDGDGGAAGGEGDSDGALGAATVATDGVGAGDGDGTLGEAAIGAGGSGGNAVAGDAERGSAGGGTAAATDPAGDGVRPPPECTGGGPLGLGVLLRATATAMRAMRSSLLRDGATIAGGAADTGAGAGAGAGVITAGVASTTGVGVGVAPPNGASSTTYCVARNTVTLPPLPPLPPLPAVTAAPSPAGVITGAGGTTATARADGDGLLNSATCTQ